jgi:hypothetical protein
MDSLASIVINYLGIVIKKNVKTNMASGINAK